jgi:tetratricopeptide (TPR) repeat protein
LITPTETALGKFYNTAADYHRTDGNHAAALKLCQSALALAISTGNSKRQSLALYQLASIKTASGDFQGAREDASASQRAAKIAGNIYIEPRALYVEALCWLPLGSYSRCTSLSDRAIHLLDLCGLSGGTVYSAIRTVQAEVHQKKSEYVEAHNIQTHLLHDVSREKLPYNHAVALSNIAQIELEIAGFEDVVQQNISTAALLFCKLNHSAGITLCDMLNAALDLQQGKLPAARSLFQKCLRRAWGKDIESVMYCLEKLGAVEQWSLTDRTLFTWPVTFLVNSFKLKQRLELHKSLQFLGDVFWAQGDQDTAVSLFTVALEGFTQMDIHRSRAECMVRLGDISKLNGDEPKAADLWKTARPLFERSSQGKQLANLDAKIAKLSHNQSQEFQPETVIHISNIHALTEHVEQSQSAGTANSTRIKEEDMALEEKKALVLVNT